MRCKACNRPFTPALSYNNDKPIFATICSSCSSSYHQGCSTSHEHVQGIDEEPLVIIAKIGSLTTEEY